VEDPYIGGRMSYITTCTIRNYDPDEGIPTKEHGYLHGYPGPFDVLSALEQEDSEFNITIIDPRTDLVYEVMSIDFDFKDKGAFRTMLQYNSKKKLREWLQTLIRTGEGLSEAKRKELLRIGNNIIDLGGWRGNICETFVRQYGRENCHKAFDRCDFYW
jgi:hypothetical protein